VHDRPFDDELNADTIELVGEEEVDGEPCYKIRVVYSGGQGESIWLFSKNDYLPRRRVRVFNVPDQGEGSIEITVSNLQIDPEVDDSMFTAKLPKGYEEIDDFAP
jgi:outer membrane lipoprotein-sorting protein